MSDPLRSPLDPDALLEHLEETRLRLALLKYHQKEEEDWQAAWDALPPDAPQKLEEARFFSRTQARTLRLIKKHERRAARGRKPHPLPRLLNAAAAAALILLLSFGTALATSADLRSGLIRLLYQITPKYTRVSFSPIPQEEGVSGSPTPPQSNLSVPSEWKGLYYPSYIPEGYSFSEIGKTEGMFISVYISKDNLLLRFQELPLETEMNINSENYIVEEVDINGVSGLLSWKDEQAILVWPSADKFLMLDSSEGKDKTLDIARSVIRIK